ncbi:MAG TPA: hypothetical protein VF158_14660 [Longimicrobiales bacterium]
MTPLIPASPQDTRDLYGMIVSDLERRVACDRRAVHQVALECVAHLASINSPEPTGARIVVLHGPDAQGLAALTRAASESLDLPFARIPLTAVSEMGWAGTSLDEWIKRMWTTPAKRQWSAWSIIVLSGLEALRVRRGTYKAGSAATRDYREGKAQNVAALLRGETVPCGPVASGWDAQRAMIILTTAYDRSTYDTDVLEEWGILPELAEILSTATWIHVPAASGIVAERAVAGHLDDVVALYASCGYDLTISPEAIRWAAAQAEERGESAATAARWIRDAARARLIAMLEVGVTDPRVALGPDDVVAPPRARAEWHD